MSEPGSEQEDDNQSKRGKVKSFFKAGWAKGLEKGKEELVKGKLMLQHSVGLGHKPNVIPPSEPNVHDGLRKVELGWHPVAGLAGKWFAEQTGLGKMITENINRYPDPTQHWAVLVEDYSHELWMDEHLDVIYINGKINREEWRTFEVGKTRFNDEALRRAGEMVIFNMREKKPAYNLINNNCQNFAMLLLESINIGAHKKFATSFEVYQRATGAGRIKDLFVAEEDEVEKPEEAEGHQNTMQHAQQVMDENTTKLDTHTTAH